jgi:hypothetical protein
VRRVSRGLDRVGVDFDDESLVANAGLLLTATMAARLDLEALINTTVRLVGRVGGHRPGRKVMTLVHSIIAGGSHIDHADVLRAGATERVLGHRVMAPSTLGTFLRSFTFGQVRQLEAVIGMALTRAWALGANSPADNRLVIDVDSTICEIYGRHKQGAAYGYTKVLGYHPILATRADTGEVLHARMRKGSANTARGVRRFCDELIARVRRAGASGPIVIRFDSGFWSAETIKTLARHHVSYTMAVRTNTPKVAAAIAEIPEEAWAEIAYTPDRRAQVAECLYAGQRLIVRRTRLTGAAQTRLWPDWRHFGFLTDLTDADPIALDRFHRAHATVELAIRDLKEGAGLEHVPSGNFSANSVWLGCAVLAHNLVRWTATTAVTPTTETPLTVARTVRVHLLAIPARIVNRSGTPVLRAPARWPWAAQFHERLSTIRAFPISTG